MQLQTADKGLSSTLGVGWGADNSSLRGTTCCKMLHKASDLTGSCEHGTKIWVP